MKKFLKVIGIIILILVLLIVLGYFILTTHTQIIVGFIQNISSETVNTKNSFEPLREAYEGTKSNGQYIIAEINYSKDYPNSYLDITYSNENVEEDRPTLFYFHGGGFFGGSKNDGDPLAESDATALLDDICAEGFNIVNVDYALVPDYHFPTPLIQANLAFEYIMEHSEEYHLNTNNIVIMGSSAGAIITSQMGSIITNKEYADLLGVKSTLKKEQVKALVIDDAPLVYDKFSLGTKVLVGNYIKGSIYINKDELKKYNNILSIDSNYIPSVLLGSEYYIDMREMDDKLKEMKVEHELIDPLAERGKVMQHCFVANERADEISKDAYDRMIKFIKQHTNI
jgi:acetyl esterase/lipase